MFPPELGSGPGDIGPVRRVGRRGRPLSLVVAVVLLAAFWVASAGMAGWGLIHHYTHDRAGDVGWMAFWTAVVALILWRVWRGGRTAIVYMAGFGTMIGLVILIGMVAFVVLAFVAPPGGSALTFLAYLLPGLLGGAALLTAGRLLRRREIREWGGY
jgi:hypothetical protein